MGDELWCGQAQNGVNFDFDLKFDLEGQSWLPPKTIGTLTKVFCIFGPNLVILAWTADELSCGQTWWRTDGRTGATTIPGGKNWPRVKNIFQECLWSWPNFMKGITVITFYTRTHNQYSFIIMLLRYSISFDNNPIEIFKTNSSNKICSVILMTFSNFIIGSWNSKVKGMLFVMAVIQLIIFLCNCLWQVKYK